MNKFEPINFNFSKNIKYFEKYNFLKTSQKDVKNIKYRIAIKENLQAVKHLTITKILGSNASDKVNQIFAEQLFFYINSYPVRVEKRIFLNKKEHL